MIVEQSRTFRVHEDVLLLLQPLEVVAARILLKLSYQFQARGDLDNFWNFIETCPNDVWYVCLYGLATNAALLLKRFRFKRSKFFMKFSLNSYSTYHPTIDP